MQLLFFNLLGNRELSGDCLAVRMLPIDREYWNTCLIPNSCCDIVDFAIMKAKNDLRKNSWVALD